ncbi:hypothetical protein GCM10009626_13420 [Brachybacterium sacelli]
MLPGRWVRAEAQVTLEQLAVFLQTTARPGSVMSHETAAELFGFPLPKAPTWAGGAPLQCRGPHAARTSGGLLVAHLPSSDPVISHRGLTMSHPLIAIRDIAAQPGGWRARCRG